MRIGRLDSTTAEGSIPVTVLLLLTILYPGSSGYVCCLRSVVRNLQNSVVPYFFGREGIACMTREKISLTLTETKQTISLTKIPVDLVRSFVLSFVRSFTFTRRCHWDRSAYPPTANNSPQRAVRVTTSDILTGRQNLIHIRLLLIFLFFFYKKILSL